MARTLLDRSIRAFAEDVYQGLIRAKPRKIPSKYLWDALGSALFEAMTLLPEYGLTDADQRLLVQIGRSFASAQFPVPQAVIELGSGSGKKTRKLLLELLKGGGLALRYYPIDISQEALNCCVAILDDVSQLAIHPIAGDYLHAVSSVTQALRPNELCLVMFLRSSLGNFEPAEQLAFLQSLRDRLRPGDLLLLGADMQKDPHQLIPAYDDPAGVTAAFNKNVLARINRELGESFDLRKFSHLALYDGTHRRVEMHLHALESCSVRIEALDATVAFDQHETILTEICYKFELSELQRLAESARFSWLNHWIDSQWPFVEFLLQVPLS